MNNNYVDNIISSYYLYCVTNASRQQQHSEIKKNIEKTCAAQAYYIWPNMENDTFAKEF